MLLWDRSGIGRVGFGFASQLLVVGFVVSCGSSSHRSGTDGGASGLGGAASEGGQNAAGAAGTHVAGASSTAPNGGTGGGTGGDTTSPEQGGTSSLTTGGTSNVTSGGASSGGNTAAGGASITGGTGSNAGSSVGGWSTTPSTVPRPDFILGADLSSVQESEDQGAKFVDTDGQVKSIAALFAAHGFNYVRLRTFVEPANLYGYANPNGDVAYARAEPYCDRDHTAEFGKQLKDAGMKLVVDIHYSDNWADPSKQIIPQSWRDVTSIDDLASRVKSYTQDLIQKLVDSGARPDFVQVGNEITPGMLIHVPDTTPNPDPWGNIAKVTNGINGATSNWPNLAKLVKSGIEGVYAVDPTIQTILHIESTKSVSGVEWWVSNILAQGVKFDVLGLSCYTAWQGQPSVWENTFQTIAQGYPDLKFLIVEYNPEARRAAEIMRNLPNQRGLGTFFWEPTQSGEWGPSLFTRQGKTYTAIPDSFVVFDGIRSDFGMP